MHWWTVNITCTWHRPLHCAVYQPLSYCTERLAVQELQKFISISLVQRYLKNIIIVRIWYKNRGFHWVQRCPGSTQRDRWSEICKENHFRSNSVWMRIFYIITSRLCMCEKQVQRCPHKQASLILWNRESIACGCLPRSEMEDTASICEKCGYIGEIGGCACRL